MLLGLNLSSVPLCKINNGIKNLTDEWVDYSAHILEGEKDMLHILPNAFLRAGDALCILCDNKDFLEKNSRWIFLRGIADDIIFVKGVRQ